jgi:hypothetical protein
MSLYATEDSRPATTLAGSSALSRHIAVLLRADRQLIASFWDDAQPASVNLENIAYWLGQSAMAAGPDATATGD